MGNIGVGVSSTVQRRTDMTGIGSTCPNAAILPKPAKLFNIERYLTLHSVTKGYTVPVQMRVKRRAQRFDSSLHVALIRGHAVGLRACPEPRPKLHRASRMRFIRVAPDRNVMITRLHCRLLAPVTMG